MRLSAGRQDVVSAGHLTSRPLSGVSHRRADCDDGDAGRPSMAISAMTWRDRLDIGVVATSRQSNKTLLAPPSEFLASQTGTCENTKQACDEIFNPTVHEAKI